MKTIKNLSVILPLILGIIYVSCSDNTTSPTTTNQLTVTPTKLKHLDQYTEGIYEAWVSFDTAHGDHNETKFNSMGKFNISASGSVVDSNGNPMVFKFKRPYVFNDAKDALITLEPPIDLDTLPGTHILSGNIVISSGSMDASLTVAGDDAFAHVGELFPTAGAKVILNTPTTLTDTDYYRGIWTCDSTGLVSLFDSLLTLPDTLGWKYEGWIVDTTASPLNYYSTGWFFNPYSADNDGAGIYRGPTPLGITYNFPGQDWVANSPPITNLKNGKYQFWITLQPTLGTFTTPFFLRIFELYSIPANATKGQLIPVQNVTSTYLPSAVLKVLK